MGNCETSSESSRATKPSSSNNSTPQNMTDWEDDEDGSFKGLYLGNKKSGYGTLITHNGDKYKGYFEKNKKEGFGRCHFVTQDLYEGLWQQNSMHGFGSYHYSNGPVYEGEFSNGEMNGFGIYHWPNGSKYIGNYKRNKRNGRGLYYDKAGNCYKGKWKDDKRCGKGINSFVDGSSYDGYWRDDHWYGFGVYTDASQNVTRGFWKDTHVLSHSLWTTLAQLFHWCLRIRKIDYLLILFWTQTKSIKEQIIDNKHNEKDVWNWIETQLLLLLLSIVPECTAIHTDINQGHCLIVGTMGLEVYGTSLSTFLTNHISCSWEGWIQSNVLRKVLLLTRQHIAQVLNKTRINTLISSLDRGTPNMVRHRSCWSSSHTSTWDSYQTKPPEASS